MNHSPYEEVQNSILKTKVLNKKCRQNKDGAYCLDLLLPGMRMMKSVHIWFMKIGK